jgi:glycosyltransferase involved in cell wall biosynthesis
MLVSFIIPAYNAANTIVRCLESIYRLSLKPEEFEVIVVDDCSTDNTVDVIESYRQQVEGGKCKVQSLTLLRQPENHRQGAARNRGVKVAKGVYICFVDADDAVTEGVVKAIRSAEDSNTDMTAYHYAFVNEQGIITKEADRLRFEEGLLFSGIEMQNKYPYWCSGPVAYIYNRAFVEYVNYPFMEGVLFEDSDFVAVHLYHAKRMMYSKELGYIAYEREGSTTRHTSYKNVADYLLLGERMARLYETIVDDVQCKVNGVKEFADGILEGACFNVAISCKRLIKLGGINEVKAYYKRIDERVSRSEICVNRNLRKYYWNSWTSLCMKHRRLTIALLAGLMPLYRIVKR